MEVLPAGTRTLLSSEPCGWDLGECDRTECPVSARFVWHIPEPLALRFVAFMCCSSALESWVKHPLGSICRPVGTRSSGLPPDDNGVRLVRRPGSPLPEEGGYGERIWLIPTGVMKADRGADDSWWLILVSKGIRMPKELGCCGGPADPFCPPAFPCPSREQSAHKSLPQRFASCFITLIGGTTASVAGRSSGGQPLLPPPDPLPNRGISHAFADFSSCRKVTKYSFFPQTNTTTITTWNTKKITGKQKSIDDVVHFYRTDQFRRCHWRRNRLFISISTVLFSFNLK